MAPPRVTIRGIQALLAVFEEQSFSRAAERENATQSGMSSQLKNLEMTLGAPLLVRGRGTMQLTPAGELAYAQGREIVRQLFELEEEIARLNGATTGTIRLGVIPTLTRAVLPRAMDVFHAEFPGISVTVLEEYSYSLMRRVVTGELDCAAVPAGGLLPGLRATFLAADQEVLVTRAGHQTDRSHLTPVRPADLSGLDLIVPSPSNVRRQELDTYFTSHGVRLANMFEMDAMLGTLELVASSDWCTILPSAICYPDRTGAVRALHPLIDPPIQTNYVIVEKAEKASGFAVQLLMDQLTKAADAVLAEWAGPVSPKRR